MRASLPPGLDSSSLEAITHESVQTRSIRQRQIGSAIPNEDLACAGHCCAEVEIDATADVQVAQEASKIRRTEFDASAALRCCPEHDIRVYIRDRDVDQVLFTTTFFQPTQELARFGAPAGS